MRRVEGCLDVQRLSIRHACNTCDANATGWDESDTGPAHVVDRHGKVVERRARLAGRAGFAVEEFDQRRCTQRGRTGSTSCPARPSHALNARPSVAPMPNVTPCWASHGVISSNSEDRRLDCGPDDQQDEGPRNDRTLGGRVEHRLLGLAGGILHRGPIVINQTSHVRKIARVPKQHRSR